MEEYYPTVVQVIPLDNHHIQVFFDDGKIVEYDISGLLDGEAFRPLKDSRLFRDTCTVMNGTLAWDLGGNRNMEEGVDIDPFTLYQCPSINEKIA